MDGASFDYHAVLFIMAFSLLSCTILSMSQIIGISLISTISLFESFFSFKNIANFKEIYLTLVTLVFSFFWRVLYFFVFSLKNYDICTKKKNRYFVVFHKLCHFHITFSIFDHKNHQCFYEFLKAFFILIRFHLSSRFEK